jgi:hypothetical protein
MITPGAFLTLAQTITKKSPIKARQKALHRFVTVFGSKPSLVSVLWTHLEAKTLPRGFRPIHLLWTMCFVKLYSSQATLSSLCGCWQLRWKNLSKVGLAWTQNNFRPRVGKFCACDTYFLSQEKIHFYSRKFMIITIFADSVGKSIHEW